MPGTACPECSKEVMSFKEFFRKAEPNKMFVCSNCGAELKRSNWVWFLMVTAVALLGLSLVQVGLQEWGLPAKVISIVLLMIACLMLIKFIGWKFIGWERVKST